MPIILGYSVDRSVEYFILHAKIESSVADLYFWTTDPDTTLWNMRFPQTKKDGSGCFDQSVDIRVGYKCNMIYIIIPGKYKKS